MVHFDSCIPISFECNAFINHVAFDGCDYFCTIRYKCEIVRFNPYSSMIHRYCTCREYDCICYDYRNCCFWASSRACCGKLFKLDCSMNEIDYIQIGTIEQHSIVTGISYNCCKDALIVAFACVLIEIAEDRKTTKVLYTTREYCIMDVLSICPCMLLTVHQYNKKYIIVINQYGEKIGCYCMDDLSVPQNLIFNPCMSDCHKSPIWAFVRKKSCYPYLCSTDIFFNDMGFIPCCCNYKICEACGCCKKPCSDHNACADIMESIALMETALAHILNAEGEKIQKVLATTDDMNKIMCVNKEVNKTIINATHLEHMLYAKLSTLSDCGLCHDFCDKECDCYGNCWND